MWSKVYVVAHLPAWSYCSQRNPTAMAEAWKRQIRHMQFRNHSNKWESHSSQGNQRCRIRGKEMFCAPATVNWSEPVWLKVQWNHSTRHSGQRKTRADSCYTRFKWKQIKCRKGLRGIQAGNTTNPFENNHQAPIYSTWGVCVSCTCACAMLQTCECTRQTLYHSVTFPDNMLNFYPKQEIIN